MKKQEPNTPDYLGSITLSEKLVANIKAYHKKHGNPDIDVWVESEPMIDRVNAIREERFVVRSDIGYKVPKR